MSNAILPQVLARVIVANRIVELTPDLAPDLIDAIQTWLAVYHDTDSDNQRVMRSRRQRLEALLLRLDLALEAKRETT